MWVPSLGWEDPLEKEMSTHSNILVWKIPWTEETGRLQSVGSERVGHNLATKPPLTTSAKSLYSSLVQFSSVQLLNRVMIKNPLANAGDNDLIPGSGRPPGEGNCNPLQYSCLETFMDRGAGGLQSMGSQRIRHN